jgi:hypothetical protein
MAANQIRPISPNDRWIVSDEGNVVGVQTSTSTDKGNSLFADAVPEDGNSPLERIRRAIRSPRWSKDISTDSPVIEIQAVQARPSTWTVPLTGAARHIFARASGAGGVLDLDSIVYRFNKDAWVATANAFQANDGTSSVLHMPGDPAASTQSQQFSPAVVGFVTDSPYFGIPFVQAMRHILIVDGKPHAASATTTGAGQQYQTFTFPSRKMREIISISGPFARFGEIAAAPADTFAPLDTMVGSFSAAAMTDSYGAIFAEQLTSAIGQALYGLGSVNLCMSAVGSTGYAADAVAGGSLTFTAASRLAYFLSSRPDMGIFMGGINDSWPLGPYGGDVSANMAVCFSAYREAVPEGLLVAFAPWAPNEVTGQTAAPQAVRAAILSNLQAVGGPWVFIDNLNGGWFTSWGTSATGQGRWQTGTSSTTGNSQFYLRTDETPPTHPTAPVGATYLGRRMETALRQAILSA